MPRLAPVVASVTPPVRQRGHVASAVRMQQAADAVGGDPARKRMQQPWQARAFTYYELLGEIWYAAQFYARALQKLELRLVRKVGQDDFEDVEDEGLLHYLDRIQDPGGGRSNLLGSYGRLKFLAGECYLLVTQEQADDPAEGGAVGGEPVEVWEMLSHDELKWNATERVYYRYRLPNTQPEKMDETEPGEWEPLEDTAIAYRFWTRHPRYSNLADGPLRGVLDLCEELVILTRAIRARGRSRLTGAGLFLIPEEVSFSDDEAANPSEDPNLDVFLDRLTQGMMAGIADEGSASAVMPIVMRIGAEWIEKFKLLKFFDPNQVYPETGLRQEVIQRIAIGLDLPPEVLLGKGGANHWSAWQIDEDSWKAHLQPVAQALVDDLTGGYLRPSMRAGGVANWDEYAIAYDAAAIVQHPDRAKDAKDLHDRGAINHAALRGAGGFDDEDAMDDAEFRQWVGIKLGDATLAVDGTVTEPVAPVVVPPAIAPGGDEGGTPADVEPGAPEPDDDEQVPAEQIAASVVPSPFDLAGELIQDRGRELAGARLRSRYGKGPVARHLDGIANRDVPAVVGRHANGDLDTLLGERHNLVAGAGDCFRPRLRQWGLSDEDVEMVVAVAEQRAAEGLFDAVPG